MEFEISLNNLSFYSYHGLYEEEKKYGNEFRVNLSVFYIASGDSGNDNIDSTVSYVDLFQIVNEEMEKPRNLLETVALSIVATIKSRFTEINKGKISIEKVHPPIPGMLGSASVSLIF